jgi:G3E family GTPase
LPLTILGGYLGAGKTTVLNHLLRHADGRRIAIVVNDFGAVNIDADLIEARDERAISLAGGCVCCGFGDDLLDTLRGLRDARPPFEHLVIETSGVALPANLRATVSLLQGVRVVATLVVADAETVRQQAADRYVGDTVREQLRAADLLLLTKGDLLPEARLDEVEAWLRGQAPAPVLRAVMGAVPPEVVLGVPEDPPATSTDSHEHAARTARSTARPTERSGSTVPESAQPMGRRESAAPSGLLRTAPDGRLRPPAHAAARFETATFEIDAPVDPQRLAAALAGLTPALARAKGLVHGTDGRLHVVQVVGRRGTAEPASPNIARKLTAVAGANGARVGRLVAISAGGPLDRRIVDAAIDSTVQRMNTNPASNPALPDEPLVRTRTASSP